MIILHLNSKEIEIVLKKLQPKIKSSLSQTNPNNKEDLEQHLKELIIKKIKEEAINHRIPSFFECVDK